MLLHDKEGLFRCEVKDLRKDLLIKTDNYELFLAGHQILRTASDVYASYQINAEAELLRHVNRRARELDRSYAEHCGEAHYGWLVPTLDGTFTFEIVQESRQANLLSFTDAKPSALHLLPKLKKYCYIDERTSAWVLGRFLELQALMETCDIYYDLRPEHVLVLPAQRRLTYLGLIEDVMTTPSERCVDLSRRGNVKTAALETLNWLEPGLREEESEYLELVRDFIETGRENGTEALMDLYDLLDRTWGVTYLPFTYYVRATGRWQDEIASFYPQ